MSMAANNSRIAPEGLRGGQTRQPGILIGGTRGKIEKIGVMADPDYPFYPEAAVKAGFRDVPLLVLAGKKDPFYGARAPQISRPKPLD